MNENDEDNNNQDAKKDLSLKLNDASGALTLEELRYQKKLTNPEDSSLNISSIHH
jgi:hypothetical protein